MSLSCQSCNVNAYNPLRSIFPDQSSAGLDDVEGLSTMLFSVLVPPFSRIEMVAHIQEFTFYIAVVVNKKRVAAPTSLPDGMKLWTT